MANYHALLSKCPSLFLYGHNEHKMQNTYDIFNLCVDVINVFSSSLMAGQNKLEHLFLTGLFQSVLKFVALLANN
jgi:hypothetical protein